MRWMIFHMTDEGFQKSRSSLLDWWKHYKHIATIEAEDEEQAWLRTNHIDEGWQCHNDGSWRDYVKFLPSIQVRSSMVGDIFVSMDCMKHRIVAGCGFQDVDITKPIAASMFTMRDDG